jgi:hypothetical protein
MKELEKVLNMSLHRIRLMKDPRLVEKRLLRVVKAPKVLRPIRMALKIRWVLRKTRLPSSNKNKNIPETMVELLAHHQLHTTSHPISSSWLRMHNSRARTPTLVLSLLSSPKTES